MRLLKGVEKFIYLFFALVVSLVLFVVITTDFCRESWFKYPITNYDALIPNAVFLLAAVVFLFLLSRWWRRGSITEFPKKIIFLCTPVLFMIQCAVVYLGYFRIGWDVSYIGDIASVMAEEGALPSDCFGVIYLQTNPNNIGIAALMSLIYQGASFLGVSGEAAALVVGLLLTDISLYLLAKTVWLLSGNGKTVLISWLLGAVFLGMSPWIFAAYTDIYSLCFTIGIFYLYLKFRRQGGHVFRNTFVLCLLAGIGYLIKATNILVFLAILLVEILHIKKESFSKHILYAGAAVVLAFLIVKGLKSLCYVYLGFSPDLSVQKSMWHYLMMGLNTEQTGNYNVKDDDLTSSISGLAQKGVVNRSVILERLDSLGVLGTFGLFWKKTMQNFGTGLFGWGKELGFVDEIYDNTHGSLGQLVRDFYYCSGGQVKVDNFWSGGAHFDMTVALAQFIWMGVLLCLLIFAVKGRQRFLECRPMGVLAVSLFAITAFVTLFETNARYLFSYLPLFVVAAVLGMEILFRQTEEFVSRDTIKKSAALLLFFLIAMLPYYETEMHTSWFTFFARLAILAFLGACMVYVQRENSPGENAAIYLMAVWGIFCVARLFSHEDLQNMFGVYENLAFRLPGEYLGVVKYMIVYLPFVVPAFYFWWKKASRKRAVLALISAFILLLSNVSLSFVFFFGISVTTFELVRQGGAGFYKKISEKKYLVLFYGAYAYILGSRWMDQMLL